MDFIKSWVFSVCLTLILAVIFSIMTPKGNMGKFYKMIISIFIFISFLYPLTDIRANDFKIDIPSLNNTYNSSLEDAEKNNAEIIIENKLMERGINADASLEISLNNDELEIKSLTVYIPDSNSKNEVQEYLLSELGMVAEVKYIGE